MTLTTATSDQSVPRWIYFLSLGLTVAGLRWMTFDYAGSPLPYFDQWLAEFNNLFLLSTVAHSPFDIWLIPHNEHYPITMKVVSMLGFFLNGYWDVKFLALASGLARAACAIVACLLFAEEANRSARCWHWLFCAAFFGLPWSVFNALNGMQISFYLADLAMLLSLLVLQQWTGYRSGIALAGLMIAGLGSMASALAIPAATLAWHLLERRPRTGFAVAWVLTLALGLAYLLLPRSTGSGFSPTPTESIYFFLQLLAWPLPWGFWGLAVLAGGIALFIWSRRHSSSAGMIAAFAVGVYATGNALMLALHRTTADFHPRHWDTIGWLPLGIIILLVNLAAGFRPRPTLRLTSVGIIVIISAAFLAQFYRISWPDLQTAHNQRDAIVQHYSDALLSGAFRTESMRINEQLMARDYSFFDNPVGRFAIPPTVAINIAATPLPALALLSPDILPVRPPSLTAQMVRFLFSISPAIAVGGMILLVIGWARSRPLSIKNSRP